MPLRTVALEPAHWDQIQQGLCVIWYDKPVRKETNYVLSCFCATDTQLETGFTVLEANTFDSQAQSESTRMVVVEFLTHC